MPDEPPAKFDWRHLAEELEAVLREHITALTPKAKALGDAWFAKIARDITWVANVPDPESRALLVQSLRGQARAGAEVMRLEGVNEFWDGVDASIDLTLRVGLAFVAAAL